MQIHEFVWTADRIDHIATHRVEPEEVEEVCFGEAFVQRAKAQAMRTQLPKMDSIEELARFWDAHDLAEFAGDLEEVEGPVFVRAKGSSIRIELQPAEARSLERIARARGVNEAAVVRAWILERLREPRQMARPARRTRRG